MNCLATVVVTLTAVLAGHASAQSLSGPPTDPQLKFLTPMPPGIAGSAYRSA